MAKNPVKQFLSFLDIHLKRHSQDDVLEDIWDGMIESGRILSVTQ